MSDTPAGDVETPELVEDATADLVAWAEEALDEHDSRFEAAKVVSDRLGAHWDPEAERAEVGFWTPELLDRNVPEDEVYLEVFTPAEDVDLTAEEGEFSFHRERVPLVRSGEFTWGVVEGVRPGRRDQLGSLYQLAYRDGGEWKTTPDPVAYSVPFGAYAPAELYDMDHLDRTRDDRDYFQEFAEEADADDELPRFDPATSMLEIHPGTASEAGSLAGLARVYEDIGEKEERGESLSPAERNFAGYDAIQVMPVEPLTENEQRDPYWQAPDPDETGEVSVHVEQPDQINWGYDIVVSAFSAPNPAILESGRPDELVDFIATCHTLPRPIKIVFDIALGHADNGGLDLLNEYYFSGPGMYGQDLDYTQPVVRAVLLEMQKRKMEFGADGIRVDGAQDFTNWDPEAEEEWHDDAFLAEMDKVTYEVGGVEYRPWMIYEDGRPWPREDWELASTYRTLIEQHPHSFQWSPISFAHNTPALLTFWATKWWRVYEVADFGSNWTTGVANHDTIRRGTQIDPTVEFNQSPVNPYLGEDYTETLDNAYNNPASNMLMHCFLPGVPMDFVHANMRAPWGFVRDTDAIWNVKVVADEANFIYWQVTDEQFYDESNFRRLKDLGFTDLDNLHTFIQALQAAVKVTDYDLDAMADMVETVAPKRDDLSAADLEAFAMAWMRDMHEYCNLSHYADEQDPDRTAFDLAVREFRQDRPWLRSNVDEEAGEHFDYRHPANGTVLYYGLRRAPDGSEDVLFVGNMEGVEVEVEPADLPIPDCPTEGWEVAIAAPGAETEDDGEVVRLDNSEAVVLTRDRT